MSNAGQAVLGIVGGIIGFAIGGPTGALYGFQIGLAVGTVVSPTELPGTFGPRLSDQRTTTAQMGTPIAEVFGIDVVGGQVLWLGDIVEHAETEEVGGKGAPVAENTTYTYTQPIAIGLCKGPKLGLMRIWENGELVYDARPQFADESDEDFLRRFTAAGLYAEGFTLYLGDEEQEADPTIELKEGVGNVPGFRGLMYIVYHDRELRNDQGQRHPTFKFEIAAAPIPDTRNVGAETLRSSYIVRVGQNGSGNLRGFSSIPGLSFGQCFDDEIIGEVGKVEIVGGFEVDIAFTAFQGLVFAPLGFSIEIHDFFERLITQVEFAGPDFLGTPTVFTNPSTYSTFFRSGDPRTSVEFFPTTATPFVVGEDYLVTVTSTIPAGRLSFGELTAASVSPGGTTIIGFNSANGVYNTYGNFGSYEGTVDVGLEEEVAVRGLYIETPTNNLRFLLQGDFPTLQLILRFTGENGPVIFGPVQGVTNGTGITRWDWDVPVGTLADAGVYEIEIRGVGVIPYFTEDNPPPTLANIVRKLCNLCGLEDLVDVDDLEDVTVSGYKVERLTDGRSAISILRQVGFFDAVESTGGVKFVRRGHEPVRTLTERDLGAHQYGSGEPPPLVTTRNTQDTELPRQLFVQYRDPARDYQDGQQASPTRLTTDAINDTVVDVAVAIDGTQALRAAEILWSDMWAGRWLHSLALDAGHSDLEPTDVLLVPVDGRLERMRIVSSEDSALILRALQLVRDDDGSYVSEAIAEPPAVVPPGLQILDGSTLVLLDLPPLRSEDNDAGVYAVVKRRGIGTRWSGAVIYRGLPGGALSSLASVTNEAVVGTLTAPLAAGLHTTWDYGNELLVDLPRGQFESRPEADLLNDGANAVAVGVHGRWELLQFRDAEQVGPTSWVLSRLLRGRRGTEHHIGTGQTGDSVVLVSGLGVVRLPLPVAEVGGDRVYRAVSIGATLATGTDVTFASTGEALRTFSPVHVTATDVDGDTLIEWTRRDRLAVEFTDPLPLSEAAEAYEVDILADSSPATVLRTLTSSTPSVVYTAAQRLDDFGSPGPTAIAVRIYQMGILGRGTPAEAMI